MLLGYPIMYSFSFYLKHPKIFLFGCINHISPIIPSKIYLKTAFRCYNNHKLNLKDPKTYNEKLQWIKLYDHNPKYTELVDKYLVKQYVTKTIGEEYVIPTLGVRDNFDDIDFSKLPNEFVLKCTHDSGSIIICKDKKIFDKELAKKKLDMALKYNWYNYAKEWAYKDIKPRIIAEKYMIDESGTELKDYKVFCFDGEPKIIQVDFDRFSGHKRNMYDLNWNILPFELQYPSDKNHIIKKPISLKKMINLSKILSKGIPHVRVDFYIIDGRIYFGELTFYHGGGFEKFTPDSRGLKMGERIKLPQKHF